MGNHRKRVAICTNSESFGGALRLLLDGYQVSLSERPDDGVADADVLVWRLDRRLADQELIDVAMTVPTLLLGDEEQLIGAVDAGCRGFLPLSASLEEIHDAVTTISEGGAVVPPDLLGTLLRHLVERRRRDERRSDALRDLTERETEVFWLAARGARKEEIGERLYISPATARTHLQRVYAKLGVHSQAELMAFALRLGMPEIEERR